MFPEFISDETSHLSDEWLLHGIAFNPPKIGKMSSANAKDLLFNTMVDNESDSNSDSEESD